MLEYAPGVKNVRIPSKYTNEIKLSPFLTKRAMVFK